MRRSFFSHNLLLKLFSLLTSVALFVFVNIGSTTTIDVDFPLEYMNLPDDIIIEGDPPKVVHATLRGPWASFRTYVTNDLKPVVISMKGAGPGLMRHIIELGNITAPGGMTIDSVRPTEIVLELDRRVDRLVPVQPDLVGKPDLGFEIEAVATTPTHVRVSGPTERMQELEFIPTRELDIEGRRDDVILETDVKAPPGPFRIKEKTVVVTVRIVEELGTRTFGDLPVRLEGAPPETKVTPDRVTVKLKGPRSVLEAIDPATLAPYIELEDVGPEAELSIKLRGNPERTQWIGAAPRVQVTLPRNLIKKTPKRK